SGRPAQAAPAPPTEATPEWISWLHFTPESSCQSSVVSSQFSVLSSQFSVLSEKAYRGFLRSRGFKRSCQFLILSNSLKVSVPICIAKFVIFPSPLAARGRLPKIFVCPAYLLVK